MGPALHRPRLPRLDPSIDRERVSHCPHRAGGAPPYLLTGKSGRRGSDLENHPPQPSTSLPCRPFASRCFQVFLVLADERRRIVHCNVTHTRLRRGGTATAASV